MPTNIDEVPFELRKEWLKCKGYIEYGDTYIAPERKGSRIAGEGGYYSYVNTVALIPIEDLAHTDFEKKFEREVVYHQYEFIKNPEKKWYHSFLDVVGMIPFIGEAADVLNAMIYLYKDDYENAALSLAGALPVIGNAVTSTKNAVKAAGAAVDVAKAGSIVSSSAKATDAIKGAKRTEDTQSVVRIPPTHNLRNLPIDPNTGDTVFDVWVGGLKRWKVKPGQTADGIDGKLRKEVQDWGERYGTIDGPPTSRSNVVVGHVEGQAHVITPPGGTAQVAAQTTRGNALQSVREKAEAKRRRSTGDGYVRPKGQKRRSGKGRQ